METNFWNFTDEQKMAVFCEIYDSRKLNPKAVEKDWWICHIIMSLFELRCSDALTFKGGTSLSKAWDVTDRFSEDVDISIDKSFFGLDGDTRSQRDKIRKLSREYVHEELLPELYATLNINEAWQCEVNYKIRKDSDADPTVLLIPYRSLIPEGEYIKGTVKVEFSCRNLREPRELRKITPIVCECSSVLECPEIMVPTVVPTRTYLEKVFLLHEEYQKDYPRYRRMSRHLYDLYKLDEKGYTDRIISDPELYWTIVEHRRTFSAMRGIDYDKHTPENITIVPPDSLSESWAEDYELMKEGFIYGPAPSWKQLTLRLSEIQQRIRGMKL